MCSGTTVSVGWNEEQDKGGLEEKRRPMVGGLASRLHPWAKGLGQ